MAILAKYSHKFANNFCALVSHQSLQGDLLFGGKELNADNAEV